MKKIYYRKLGHCGIKRIHLLDSDLKPTHQYTTVNSWEQAKYLLEKWYDGKVHESSDMFKVIVND